MSNDSKCTIIQNGTDIEGSVSSNCPIEVSGTVKGELLAPELSVSSSGRVHGKVKVEQLVSQGEIAGEIDADSVKLSGKVSDKTVINAGTLEVTLNQPGKGLQVSFGNCRLNVGDRPDSSRSRMDSVQEEQELEPTL